LICGGGYGPGTNEIGFSLEQELGYQLHIEALAASGQHSEIGAGAFWASF